MLTGANDDTVQSVHDPNVESTALVVASSAARAQKRTATNNQGNECTKVLTLEGDMGADGSHLVSLLSNRNRTARQYRQARLVLPYGGYYPSLLCFLRLGNQPRSIAAYINFA
jgi:hypothetical protein